MSAISQASTEDDVIALGDGVPIDLNPEKPAKGGAKLSAKQRRLVHYVFGYLHAYAPPECEPSSVGLVCLNLPALPPSTSVLHDHYQHVGIQIASRTQLESQPSQRDGLSLDMSISCCSSPVSSRWSANVNTVSGGIWAL